VPESSVSLHDYCYCWMNLEKYCGELYGDKDIELIWFINGVLEYRRIFYSGVIVLSSVSNFRVDWISSESSIRVNHSCYRASLAVGLILGFLFNSNFNNENPDEDNFYYKSPYSISQWKFFITTSSYDYP
jgi:hypothetical protein